MSRDAILDDLEEPSLGDSLETSSEQTDSAFESLLGKVARSTDSSPLAPLPKVGAVVGEKYRIEAELGHGGMGAVFRATHLVSQKPVAVKWMLRSATDERARRRFLREAQAAGRIDHPNVVNVYDVVHESPSLYLVMELLHGESLRARLERGPLPVSVAVDLLLPAMRGVAAVHRADVIHRDLKPDNIFLCTGPDGAPREAKVLDFGVSAVTACDPDNTTLSADGALLGTPAYMSPEQVQSSHNVDATSDIYSFGVILYEAVTGRRPFLADSYSGLVLAIVHETPPPLRALRADLPAQLEQVILRALAKHRGERYADMESFIAAIAPFGSSESRIIATSSGTFPTTTVRRRSRTFAIGAAFIVTLVAALTLGWSIARGPRPAIRSRIADVASAPIPAHFVPSENVPARKAELLTSEPSPVAQDVAVPEAAAPEVREAPPPARERPPERKPRPHPVKPPLKPADPCQQKYSLDAAGRLIFKLECM